MENRGRIIRFTALLVLTTLALTGFSTKHTSHSSGGGCSSSHQDHDSSSSPSSGPHGSSGGGSYHRRPTPTPTHHSSPGGGNQGTHQDAKVLLVLCATSGTPYATVQVTNPNRESGRFQVSVTFVDDTGARVTEGTEKVKVDAGRSAIAKVRIGSTDRADAIARCDVNPSARRVS